MPAIILKENVTHITRGYNSFSEWVTFFFTYIESISHYKHHHSYHSDQDEYHHHVDCYADDRTWSG